MTKKEENVQPQQSFIQSDLINVAGYGKEKITFNPDRGEVGFYCHDCNKIVETNRPEAKKIFFTCKLCKSKKIAIGTEEGLKERYEKRMQMAAADKKREAKKK